MSQSRGDQVKILLPVYLIRVAASGAAICGPLLGHYALVKGMGLPRVGDGIRPWPGRKWFLVQKIMWKDSPYGEIPNACLVAPAYADSVEADNQARALIKFYQLIYDAAFWPHSGHKG